MKTYLPIQLVPRHVRRAGFWVAGAAGLGNIMGGFVANNIIYRIKTGGFAAKKNHHIDT